MAHIPVTQKDSVADQMEYLHYRIARRAYELSRSRDGWGDSLGDWLAAERELMWVPPAELREQAGTLTVKVMLPGVAATDIRVDITPREVVIEALTEGMHGGDEGQVHRCEFTARQAFRLVTFPEAIDPTKVEAEYENGVLTISAPVAKEIVLTRVEVKAA